MMRNSNLILSSQDQRTLSEYFRNETFAMNPETLKKKIIYPKKFNRVYNIIIDPDDFSINKSLSDISNTEFDNLMTRGIIKKIGANSIKYFDSEKSSADAALDEYYVTIEGLDSDSQ